MSAKEILQNFIPHRHMQFAPVRDDDGDELSESIKNDKSEQDDNWDLHDSLDADKLVAFWDEALQELGPEQTESEETA